MKYKALYPGLRIEREDIGEVITLVEELCDGSWECEIEEAQLIDPEGDYIDDNFEWVKYEYSYTAAELRGWIR